MKNFLKLFSKRDYVSFGFLFVGLFLFSLIEIFSIGLIPVLVQVIIDPIKINEFYYHPLLSEFLEKESKKNLLLIFSIIIMSIFLLKNLYLLLITWLYELKLKNWISNLTNNLVKKSLNISYENFIKTDHSKLINIIVNEFDTVRLVIRTYFVVFKEVLVLVMLCVTFLFINTKFFLISFAIISIISVSLLVSLKQRLKTYGAEQLRIRAEQMKVLDISFRGIKYIKIFDKIKYFSDVMYKLIRKRNSIGAIVQIILVLPKLLIEVILLLFFLVTCNFLFLSLQGNPDQFFINLSLMAVIVVRLIPIYSNLNLSFIQLKFSSPTIKSISSYLLKNFTEEKRNNFSDISTPLENGFEQLEIKNVSYSFKTKNQNNFLIKDINFKILRGEKIGIIGETGSGKTTVINCILGLLKIDRGEIILNGKSKIFEDIKSWHSLISFVPQDIFLMDSNIYQNIALSNELSSSDINNINKILRTVKLDKFLDNFTLNLGDKASKISEGEKQRVGIARAIFKKSEFLVLDETTSSLDVNTEKEIMKSLKNEFKDMTIITIAHRLSTIEDYDKVLLIKEGVLSKIGKPKEVIDFFKMNKT